MNPPILKPARIGSVSTGTLRTEDLLPAFADQLQALLLTNADYFNPGLEQAQDAAMIGLLLAETRQAITELSELTADDTDSDQEFDTLEKCSELIQELTEALDMFAPPYCIFSAHPGDGADFGYWPMDIDDIKEQVGFVSASGQEYPPGDYAGEWLHVNERGNCTLYIRANGQDRELWGIV